MVNIKEIEEKYKLFQLDSKTQNYFKQLADLTSSISYASNQIIIETIIIENGQRKVLTKEEKENGKLV